MFAKNYHLHWIAGRANIISKDMVYIFFNFGRGCYGSFPMLFPKAPASCCKNILNQFFLHCISVFMSSKIMYQIFKILFHTGEIDIFVLSGVVFFSKYIQLKSFFLWRKEHQRCNLRHSLVEKLSKINVEKY